MFYTERDTTIPLSLSSNVDPVTAQEIRFILSKGGTVVVDKRKTTGGIIVDVDENVFVLITETEVVDAGTYKLEIYLVDQAGEIRALTPTSLSTSIGTSQTISPTNPTICFIKSDYTE